jgi:hypothetical protein
MYIENRVRYESDHRGDCPALQAWDIEGACQCDRPLIVVSEYRYLAQAPQGRDASRPAPDRWPAFDAPYQEPFTLTPPEAQ